MALFPQRLLRLAAAAFGVFAISAVQAQAANVFLLADDETASGTSALVKALQSAGHEVTMFAPEYAWDGVKPSLDGIDVVIHLNGATVGSKELVLSVVAQQALEEFVLKGGGYIGSQWNGFEYALDQAEMDELVLQTFDHSASCHACKAMYTVVTGYEKHPLLADLPLTFDFFADGHNNSKLFDFTSEPATVLMDAATDFSYGPGVAVREVGNGRVASFSIAPNDGSSETLQDANILQLYLNAVAWAADNSNKTPIAEAAADQSSAEATSLDGASFTLDGSQSTDPDGDSLSYEWTGPMGKASGERVTIVLPPPAVDSNSVAHEVTLTVTDARGASASMTLTLTVTDTTAPVISGIPGPLAAEATSAAGAPVSFGSFEAEDAVDGRRDVSCSHAAGHTFPLGVTEVACSAGDGHGNNIKSSFSVTVRDTTKPRLTLPANVIAEATSPAGAIVTFAATATDVVDENVTVTCSKGSGSTFALTVTPVTCTATDDAGNATTEGFPVTVSDTTAPAIGRITPNKTYLWSPNHVLVNVELAYTVTDAVSSPVCKATVSSDEAVDADGDGSTDVDWLVVNARSVWLLAERDGSGDGRVYTITVACADAAGNKSTSATSVYVPKSQSR